MTDMLKRHEVQVLRRPGHIWKEIAALSGVSVRDRAAHRDAAGAIEGLPGEFSQHDLRRGPRALSEWHRESNSLRRLAFEVLALGGAIGSRVRPVHVGCADASRAYSDKLQRVSRRDQE